MQSAIVVKDLLKTFNLPIDSSHRFFRKRKFRNTTAINGIDFRVKKGELVGLIGKNGAGKTTTLKCLTGLLVPDSGEVEVLGYIPSERKYEFLQKISMVMGNRSQLWWELPARETFLLNKEIYEIGDSKYGEILNEMVGRLDVNDLLDVPVRKLSLGERMKCELIASLLHGPELLFLDEPTLGLDIISQKNLRGFLADYHKEYNSTIILTSHNMEDIKDLCERLIIIDKGNILYDGELVGFLAEYPEVSLEEAVRELFLS